MARLGATDDDHATDLSPVQEWLRVLAAGSDRPLAVGFGLDQSELLERVRRMGATPVIESALVQALHAGQSVAGFLGPSMGS